MVLHLMDIDILLHHGLMRIIASEYFDLSSSNGINGPFFAQVIIRPEASVTSGVEFD